MRLTGFMPRTLAGIACAALIIILPGSVSAGENDTVTKLASERWHAWRTSRPSFPLAAWSYFHRYEGSYDEFKLYRDAGLTMVAPTREQYPNAVRAGLDIIAGHFEPLHESVEALREVVAFPSSDDATVAAYSLKDEPTVDLFPALGKATAYLYRNDRRNAIPIIDFRPNWAVPYPRWNMTYETYFERYLDEVAPCVLLNCHYPLMRDGSTRPVFYANIEYYRAKALELDIGLMGFILLTAHRFPASPQIDYRAPSESDIRWSAYTYLAYGAQGLWYYNWRIEDARFGTAIVDGPTGQPTPYYPIVTALNREIGAIGPVLMKLRSTGVYHTNEIVPPGTTRYYKGYINAFHDWEGDDFILGAFENRDDPGDDSIYVMIVNKRHAGDKHPEELSARASFTVYPDYPAVRFLTPGEGTVYKVARGGDTYTLDIGGGQGVLVQFSKK